MLLFVKLEENPDLKIKDQIAGVCKDLLVPM